MGPGRLADFIGSWDLTRRIVDSRAGAEGQMEGRAEYRIGAGAGLVCEETGMLRFGASAPVRAERRYLWREDGPGRIAVHYEDGRSFHAFALGASAEAEHLCTPDLYRVAYDFRRWPRWRAVWTVRGPRKDYVSVSNYLPAGA